MIDTQKRYYSSQVLLKMTAIEDLTGNEMMFHNLFPDIQADYQKACESQDHKPMRAVYYKLCRTIDALKGDETLEGMINYLSMST